MIKAKQNDKINLYFLHIHFENFQRKDLIMLFAPAEKGQGLVEYAIILALVAIVVIAVMRLLGPKIGNTFSTISRSLP
jgi:pilus assembly protein Flp/PilA